MHKPEQKYVHTLVLDAKGQPETIRAAADWLAAQSRGAVLIMPGRVVPYQDLPSVEGMEAWPDWASHPWIIAGRLKAGGEPIRYEGPFIHDTQGDSLDEQVRTLLAIFDWAVFRYFTTYHDDLPVVVTARADLADNFQQRFSLLERQHGPAPYIERLANATFYDEGMEGWFAYELAQERGEPPPLILTCLEMTQLDSYFRYDYETETWEDHFWFEEPVSRLKSIREFTVKLQHGGLRQYCLHQASDHGAYLALWAEASHDHHIALATFSADCDVHLLEQKLRDVWWFDVLRDSRNIATWAYGQVYGGGADEHHAVFHSRDARATQRIWELAGKSGISRF